MNINLNQASYVDYNAANYFKAANVTNIRFTPKVVKVGDEDTVLIHVDGEQTSSGICVNLDIWPRNHATAEDIKAMPKTLDNIYFRVGFWPEVDENGEKTLRTGSPKWVEYVHGTERVSLTGDKREFGE